MLVILIAIVLMSFIYPMFANYDFSDVSKINDFSSRYNWPNAKYWFGTDANGHSLFDGLFGMGLEFHSHFPYCYSHQLGDWGYCRWNLGCLKRL